MTLEQVSNMASLAMPQTSRRTLMADDIGYPEERGMPDRIDVGWPTRSGRTVVSQQRS
jgi:hypothetical protein